MYADGSDIAQFDGVFMIGWFKTKILEDIALSAAKYMQSHGKKVFNSEVLYTRSRSKLSQYVIASTNGIAMTPFLFAKDIASARQAFQTHWSEEFPLIMKGVQSSRGNDNYLVRERDQALELLNTMHPDDGPWLVCQGFVPNDGDYRIIVMGEEVKYVLHARLCLAIVILIIHQRVA